jgi:hypothetical protein
MNMKLTQAITDEEITNSDGPDKISGAEWSFGAILSATLVAIKEEVCIAVRDFFLMELIFRPIIMILS